MGGTYDTVCSYADVKSLQKQKIAVFDVAGNAEAKKEIYEHFGEDVVYFGIVGQSHVQDAGKHGLFGTSQALLNGGAVPASFLVFKAMQEAESKYGKKNTTRMM